MHMDDVRGGIVVEGVDNGGIDEASRRGYLRAQHRTASTLIVIISKYHLLTIEMKDCTHTKALVPRHSCHERGGGNLRGSIGTTEWPRSIRLQLSTTKYEIKILIQYF